MKFRKVKIPTAAGAKSMPKLINENEKDIKNVGQNCKSIQFKKTRCNCNCFWFYSRFFFTSHHISSNAVIRVRACYSLIGSRSAINRQQPAKLLSACQPRHFIESKFTNICMICMKPKGIQPSQMYLIKILIHFTSRIKNGQSVFHFFNLFDILMRGWVAAWLWLELDH